MADTRRATPPRTAERLGRMLVIVPYVVRHPGCSISEVASLFSVKPEQLRRDLDLLFMSGLPPYGPGDLIDVEVDEDDRIWITMADHFSRPLRLSRSEALALTLRSAELLLRRNDLDEFAELAAQVTPAALDVLDERVRLVLREHRDPADTGVHAVREHEIDDAELAAEGRRGLAAEIGEMLQSLATPAGHDDGQRVAGDAADVAALRSFLTLAEAVRDTSWRSCV